MALLTIGLLLLALRSTNLNLLPFLVAGDRPGKLTDKRDRSDPGEERGKLSEAAGTSSGTSSGAPGAAAAGPGGLGGVGGPAGSLAALGGAQGEADNK